MQNEHEAEPGADSAAEGALLGVLVRWVGFVARRPVLVAVVCLLLTVASALYSAATIRINSDDSTLISQDEPFRQDYKVFVDNFPQFDETTLIVITTQSIDLAEDAVDRLSEALLAQPDLIDTLFAPSADDFFEDHGFLYLDDDDLDDVVERLAEAQPALTALVEDPSLRGLFDEFELSLDELEEEGELPSGFTRMANRISETAVKMLAGRPQRIGWADELVGDEGETVYRMIIVQGRKHFDESIATAQLMDGIRKTASDLGLTPANGVTVRLTGMVPLAHDELESLQSGLTLAGTVATFLLALILVFGVRSLRIVTATFGMLISSIAWTTAFAMIVVGEFNLISAAFAVLLIGLGVDFAIHLGLAYEEETRKDRPVPEALQRATAKVGGAVSLCALTSSIGFFAFVPTRYYGLAALGIIAGGGILIALVATFTVFPALLALMRAPSKQHETSAPFLAGVHPWLVRNAGRVLAVTAVVTVAAVAIDTRMTFDFSTLGMKDPSSESMTTLRELWDEDILTDYSATVIAPDIASAEVVAEKLLALPLVSEVESPSSYLPENQEEKLEVLDDARFFLESVLDPDPPQAPPTPSERFESARALRDRIATLEPRSEAESEDPAFVAAKRLGVVLGRVLDEDDAEARVAELEDLVVSDLSERIDWLRRAISVGEVGFEDLPANLRERVVSDEGVVRVVALPAEEIHDVRALTDFVEAVATVDPHATGRPAVEVGIGDIVVDTFQTAIGVAAVVVALLLVYVLRSPIDALTVFVPITLAGLITIAVGVLVDLPFNMSNVVVIPLVIGLGVDNGIHVFMRFRHDESLADMMESSTPRAVILSALTTLAAFGSLALSGHRGIHSLGALLSVAIISLMVCTLIVLPSLIVVIQRWRGDAREAGAPR